MISPGEILGLRRREPFVPIRIHVNDGNVHEVRWPGLLTVGWTSIMVGFPPAGTDVDYYERFVIVTLRQITKIDTLAAD